MKLKKIYTIVVVTLFVSTVVVMFTIGIRTKQKSSVKDLDYHFRGVVDSVSYDIKGFATVIVKGSHYYLGDPNWNFYSNRIQKGDSLIKKRNSMLIKLIRPNGQVVIVGREFK